MFNVYNFFGLGFGLRLEEVEWRNDRPFWLGLCGESVKVGL